MTAFRHILFPIDFSNRSDSVRPFVKSFAQRFQSKITLMHVIHIPTGWYGGADGGYPILFDLPAMAAAAKKQLADFFAPAPSPGVVVKTGDPAHEITAFASENQVDLIMLPTHGYGKFRSLML